MDAIRERGFVVRQADGVVDVSSPEPLTERVAVLGAALYAIAIVVEAVRSRAWLPAILFVLVALSALCAPAARVRYRLGVSELEVTTHSLLRRFVVPLRQRSVRLATVDVVDFVAASDAICVLTRDGGAVELPRGTMRSHDEATVLATFLRDQLGDLRARQARYRSF